MAVRATIPTVLPPLQVIVRERESLGGFECDSTSNEVIVTKYSNLHYYLMIILFHKLESLLIF